MRGIRRFTHEFSDGNFVVSGPNGSVKSGLIDAIEFALTGDICRLSGTGTSGISIAVHAPHVDFRENSKNSFVIIKLINKSTGNIFTLERKVTSPKKPKIEPANEEAKVILNFLSQHTEFSLSRREILKFIVTEPKERANEVQILLKLHEIDKIRGSFKKLNNEIERTSKEKINRLKQTELELLNHFRIQQINKENILEKINESRAILSLEKITEITASAKFSFGIVNTNNKKRLVQKDVLCKRINSLLEKINNLSNIKDSDLRAIEVLRSNTDFLRNIHEQNFYENGLDLIINEFCPFCDTEYDIAILKKHIQEKVQKNRESVALKNNIDNLCESLRTNYSNLINEIEEINRDVPFLELNEENERLIVLKEGIKFDMEVLRDSLNNLGKIYELFQNPHRRFDSFVLDNLKNILTVSEKIPDSSTEEREKQFLIISDEKFYAYRSAKNERDLWIKRKEISNKLLSLFEEVSEKELNMLYESVEKDFSKFYSKINNDDEKDFNAQLIRSNGGLNLEVDFYGRGVFPPNALHSEGHQDSMGLCLYLALSKKIIGNNFTFCLLDDVLMSIDSHHRREFCRLLKSEFPETQFIITTHDEVWKKQLISEGIVKSKQVLSFKGWSVDNGPSIFNEKEITEEIDSYIENDNISEAASALRRYLEYIMTELSIKLRAKLEPNYNNSYELGELLSAVIGQYKDYLKKAKEAANSWNKQDKKQKINQIDDNLTAMIQKTQMEQWSVNAKVHYNDWANLTKNDFFPVKNAFFNLVGQFRCEECETWLNAFPLKGAAEQVKCDCGTLLFNLKKKS